MKKLALLSMFCLVGLSAANANPPHGGFGVSFGVFYSSLAPYGEWISVGTDVYGWRPLHVAVDWRPYAQGRWIWTDDGWYWASDEPWGWAAYHYGRWHYDDYYGWIWIPGYDWAPAWVEWRYGGDYVGWAPLGPYAVFSVSFGIHYRNHWVTPHHWWSFVHCGHIAAHDVHRYVYRHEDNQGFMSRTRDVGNVRYEGGRIVTRGPERGEVERRGKTRIDRADIVDVSDRQGERVVRGNNNRERIETYRPRISASDAGADVGRPAAVRHTERPVNLDPRGFDVRSREEDVERGRDARRSDLYRQQRMTNAQQEQPRTDDPGVRTYEPRRSERNVEQPTPQRRESRPNLEQMAPRVQQREQLRSREPERTIRRPEFRSGPSTRIAPQAEPKRNEGGTGRSEGGRGTDRGGSRGSGERR